MKTYNKILVPLFLLIAISINAQTGQRTGGELPQIGEISGILIDEKTTTPIEYGNIVLFRQRDSMMVTGTISNKEGKFILEKLPPGRFYLKVSFMGYAARIIDEINIRPGSTTIDAGTISLIPTFIDMDEVLVRGEREMMGYNLDKRVITVDKDLTSSGGSALDVMQNIPSVNVDVDGNVSLRNSSNITFLIDSRPSGLAGISSTDLLTQIPASSIEAIEVVTNPSAKYDPEGTAGIINIILKKRSIQGVNGLLSLNAGTGDRYNSSLSLNYRNSDFNFFSNYDTRFNKFNSLSNSNRTSSLNNIDNYLLQDQNSSNSMNSHNVTLGSDYYLGDKNTFTLTFGFRKFEMNNTGLLETRDLDQNYNLANYFTRDSEAGRGARSYNYTIGYKREFDSRFHELTFDAMYSDNKMNREEDIYQTRFNSDFTPVNAVPSLQRSASANTNKMIIIQSNYTHPFSDNAKMEAGFRSTIKNLTMRNDYYIYNHSSDLWNEQLLLKNHFAFEEQVHAVYGMYSGKLSELKYQLGLRAEQVYTNGTLELTGEIFNNDYFSLYPTIHTGIEILTNQEIQLSYSRRIDRPSHRQINPYVDYSDSLNISSGNPNLKPQYVNSLELGYSSMWDKTSFLTTLFLRQTDDVISSVSRLQTDGTTITTVENIAKNLSYGVEFITTHPIFSWWRMNANFSFFNTKIEDKTSIIYDDFSWTARLNSSMTLWEGIQLQINGSYSSPSILVPMMGGFGGGGSRSAIMAQTELKELYSVDVAFRKDFMDGKLSLTLRASDIFNSRNFDSKTIGEGFFTTNYRTTDSRNIFLGISYRLDNNNQQREKRRTIGDEGSDEF